MLLMQLAELMHKSLKEVRELPASEITLWVAYYNLKEKPKEDDKTTLNVVDQFKLLTVGAKENVTDQAR